MPINFKILTWQDVIKSVRELCNKIVASGFSPDVLIPILRGGAAVALMISDYLGVKNMLAVRAILYRGINKPGKHLRLLQRISVGLSGKKVLIIDDVADTGRTLKAVVEHIKQCGAKEVRVATLHLKPRSIFTPDFYIEVTNDWIVYPWEYHEFLREVRESMERGDFSEEEMRRAEEAIKKINKILKESGESQTFGASSQ